MLAVDCRQLCKTYEGRPPVEAVRGLDLQVQVGQCFGLLGPNGAGKTTSLEILEGLLRATSGDVRLLGRRWDEDRQWLRERIGITFQDTLFTERLTVVETLTLFRSFYAAGIDPDTALARVSLGEKRQARVGRLSGGQRQRLAIACALVGDPQLLFLDEPTTGLDPQSRREVWEIIDYQRRRGRTVLLTTHYMDEAERLCDRVAIIDHGRAIAEGSPRELIASLGGEHILELSFTGGVFGEGELAEVRQLPGVHRAQLREQSSDSGEGGRGPAQLLAVAASEVHLATGPVLEFLARRGYALSSLTTHHASLEDVFVAVAGRDFHSQSPAGELVRGLPARSAENAGSSSATSQASP